MTAARSIPRHPPPEERPVGFSVTSLDTGAVSWKFLELGKLPAVIITTPADHRLVADDPEPSDSHQAHLTVRAKAWGLTGIAKIEASIGEHIAAMAPIPDSTVWEATLPSGSLSPGVHLLRVIATDVDGDIATDEIQVVIGADRPPRHRAERDEDNSLDAWPEHGLLGTHLGPNKNGRKW